MTPALYRTGGYTLYGTSACHLCEVAEHLLLSLAASGLLFDYVKVDIAEADELFQRYGVRIPVLQHPDGSELDWPFDSARAQAFIESR